MRSMPALCRAADRKVLFAIQRHCRCHAGDRIFPYVTALGNGGAIWLAAGGGLCCFEPTRKTGINVFQALFFSIALIFLLKRIFSRSRPCDVYPDVSLLIRRPPDYSFPSGHALSSFAAAVALASAGPMIGIPAFFIALAIAFSRLYLFVHYPADVLAGSLLGILMGTLAILL